MEILVSTLLNADGGQVVRRPGRGEDECPQSILVAFCNLMPPLNHPRSMAPSQYRGGEARSQRSRRTRLTPRPNFYSQDVPMLRLERVDLSVQVLCFGLFPASQVFARVFGAPATRPHSLGIRLVG